MGWAKFDDRWATHPKLLAAGATPTEVLEAKALDASGICYSAGQETDGFVADSALCVLAAGHRAPKRIADRLVREGRWIRDDERKGYLIHDYLDYNESRESAQARRDEKREAGRRGGLRSGQVRRGSTNEAGASGLLEPPPQAGAHTVGELPTRPVPTNTDPPPPNTVGGERPAEEEDPETGQDPTAAVCRLVAERRYAKLTDPPPEGFRRDRWLAKTAAGVLASSAGNIPILLAGGFTVDAIVDSFEPPERPASVAQLYPAMGEHAEPVWDLDDQGVAVARTAP